MPIDLTCPGCGKQLRLADEHAGKAGRCPACQATFQIPTAGPAQVPGSPFGGAPTQAPANAPNPFAQSPPPQANLFGEQQSAGQSTTPFAASGPPNPFASTSGMSSPYGGANPYQSPQTPNMYSSGTPGEGQATASIILGIISIVFAVTNLCCCGGTFLSLPCGIIGIILAFQVPPERRMPGLILNIIGLAISALYVLFMGVMVVIQIMNQP